VRRARAYPASCMRPMNRRRKLASHFQWLSEWMSGGDEARITGA
jgi:hypothetical protein